MLVSLLGLAGSAFLMYEGGQLAGAVAPWLLRKVAAKIGGNSVKKLLSIIADREPEKLTPEQRTEVAKVAAEHGSPDARYLAEVALKESKEVTLHG